MVAGSPWQVLAAWAVDVGSKIKAGATRPATTPAVAALDSMGLQSVEA